MGPLTHPHYRLERRCESAKYKVQVAPTDHHNKAKNISILIMSSKVLYFVSNRKSDFMIIIFYIFIYLYFAIKTTPIKENVFDTYSTTIKNYMYLYAFFFGLSTRVPIYLNLYYTNKNSVTSAGMWKVFSMHFCHKK